MFKIRAFYLALLLVLVGALSWGAYIVLSGQSDDLTGFLVDRRESAGQSQPDRGATCQYNLDGASTLVVERKAHGKLIEHRLVLADTLVEPYFGGQQALIETASTADTYNCTNGEFISHQLNHVVKADLGDPIGRVLFSSTGRSVVITLNREGKERGVELYTFKTNPGDSEWNPEFGPLTGEITYKRLVGESLVVIVASGNGPRVHTYNFRSSHAKRPWNEFDLEQRPFSPQGELVGSPRFENRGKLVQIDVREGDKTQAYQFDFTCRQRTAEGEPNEKPCVWSAVVH